MQIDGETVEIVTDFILLASKITADGNYSHEIKKTLAPWNKRYDKPRQHIKKQRHYFTNKGPYSQSYGFSISMYGCKSQTIKNAEHEELKFFNCGVEEDSWEFLDSKEIKPVNPKGNQYWILIGRNDAEAQDPILWPPDVKN